MREEIVVELLRRTLAFGVHYTALYMVQVGEDLTDLPEFGVAFRQLVKILLRDRPESTVGKGDDRLGRDHLVVEAFDGRDKISPGHQPAAIFFTILPVEAAQHSLFDEIEVPADIPPDQEGIVLCRLQPSYPCLKIVDKFGGQEMVLS